MIHDFNEKLEYSLGEREKFDINILKDIITGCVSIEKTIVEVDKTGIDYIATLRKGATINIDAKTRIPGTSKYWHNGEPEIALEIWSKCEASRVKPKIGWTLNESSLVDYVLYTFDRSDTTSFIFYRFRCFAMRSERTLRTGARNTIKNTSIIKDIVQKLYLFLPLLLLRK